MDDKLKSFSVQVYGDLIKYSDTISKGRCRIFYKGENRNGGYITDSFAQKLLDTIPYTPVKGIYDFEEEDFTDHGHTNSEGRIYGIVPETYNLQWETHLDDDGVSREYACVDILLYTEMYKEAKEIPNKAQSMELFPPSIKGSWKMIGGKSLYVYENASFFGLQALGDEVEPCFEGAAFYSLRDSIKELIDKIDNYSIRVEEDMQEMNKINFKLSDSDKHNLIWSNLNPDFCEEGNWTVSYGIIDIYDNYALAVNYETRGIERVYYTKDDKEDSVTIGAREDAFIIDVNAQEKAALEAIYELNNSTYELSDETFKRGQEYNEEKISEFEQKITELENEKNTLTTERDTKEDTINTLNSSLATAEDTINALQAKNDELVSYKKGIEDNNKIKVISKYAEKLSEDVINTFTAKKDEYTIEELERELAFELVSSTPSIFSKVEEPLVPKEIPGRWDFLNKHEKN